VAHSTEVLHDERCEESHAVSTTTIRIQDDLKARIAAAADRLGKSPHAFMLDAIAHQVEQAELDEAFHRLADERWRGIEVTGATVGWDEAREWVEARLHGKNPARPVPRKPAG
jgi:predicted transcriptional regulator